MEISPFHIYYKARKLTSYVNDDDKLIAAFASSDIKIFPYQIAAALFALRSPYMKGAILADEGSLGKTYEGFLVATQQWYEGNYRQLLVLPANMVHQWRAKIDSGFTLPYKIVDSEEAFKTDDNPFDRNALVVTTYDFAVEKSEYIAKIEWDLAIFDEADCLFKSYTGENKTANTLKRVTEGAFRLLLTPTPITMSIMDIYGLLYFIDETILPDEKEFYDRYFRKPENYAELSGWVSKYCFRTLKTQVTEYVNFTNRIPYTVGYELTAVEKKLYEKLEAYLSLPHKFAYPKMERYDLTLMFYHIVSSSPQALCRTLNGAIGRLEKMRICHADDEKEVLCEIRACAEAIALNGKMKTLLRVLKKSFSRLRQLNAEKKAIIFTDNRLTQKVLHGLLAEKGYGVLTYCGENRRDYSIMERFRNDKKIEILISTDDGAKGLDIEFCPVVVNYDLLYNVIGLEQRITRCHRQGQQSDVLVVNLLGKDNFADVRIMELINKRVLQFDGIFGMSDNLLGNFGADIDDVLHTARHRDEIQEAFRLNLTTNKTKNKELTEKVQNTIFASFTREVADRITLTPAYVEDKIKEVNDTLWQVVKWYFEDYNKNYGAGCYTINEDAKIITAGKENAELPDLFYYWDGHRNRRYRSLSSYGMSPGFRPHQGRITLASVFGRHVLDEVYCESAGSLTVGADIEPCRIALYDVTIMPNGRRYYTFAGQTETGTVLSDEACREIMELPVLEYSENSRGNMRRNYNTRMLAPDTQTDPIDSLVPAERFIQKYLGERNTKEAEEIDTMKRKTAVAKTALEREVKMSEAKVKEAERVLADAPDRISKIRADKNLKLMQAELRQKRDNLFMERMRLDLKLEEQINAFIDTQRFTAKLLRHYVIEVRGNK